MRYRIVHGYTVLLLGFFTASLQDFFEAQLNELAGECDHACRSLIDGSNARLSGPLSSYSHQ